MKRKTKRIISIITILVALILLVGCATWYVLNNNASDNDKNNTSSVEQTDNESVQDENVPTSDTENHL